MNEQWFAVVNPNSGKGRTAKNWPHLYQTLLNYGIDIKYKFTSFAGEGTLLAKEAQKDGFRKIIAVGGDGTVNEVLNGLLEQDKLIYEETELAILEHGTGSDFVRSFQMQKGIHNFIKLLQRNKTIKVDIGRIDYQDKNGKEQSHYFLNALNVGLGAEVVNRVNNNKNEIGSKISYFTATIATLLNFRKIDVRCSLENNDVIENRFSGIVICNGRYIGGGMHIAPQARTDDGLFDIVFIKDISKWRLLTKFPTIYLGKHVNLPDIAISKTGKLSLFTKEDYLFEADGETLGFTPFDCQVIPGLLNLRI